MSRPDASLPQQLRTTNDIILVYRNSETCVVYTTCKNFVVSTGVHTLPIKINQDRRVLCMYKRIYFITC